MRTLGPRPWRLFLLASLIANTVLLVRFLNDSSCLPEEYPHRERSVIREETGNGKDNSTISSISSRQIVFVGGVPRSGTTLARVMLDAHPEIRCGEETRVIPRIISMRSRWSKAEKEHQRLEAAGLNDDTLDQATRAFVSEIILNHGAPAKYLCNKDPLVLNYMYDIIRMFPKAKIVLMVRDGRAVAYSIVSRNVTISGVDSKSFMSAALFWNKVVERMINDCKSIKEKCLMVFYEKLVANPREWMGRILEFLHIPWHDNVLHHHLLINSEVSLSKMEPSSNQVKEAVHTNAVEKWRENLPARIKKDIYRECDMLKELGYPP